MNALAVHSALPPEEGDISHWVVVEAASELVARRTPSQSAGLALASFDTARSGSLVTAGYAGTSRAAAVFENGRDSGGKTRDWTLPCFEILLGAALEADDAPVVEQEMAPRSPAQDVARTAEVVAWKSAQR